MKLIMKQWKFIVAGLIGAMVGAILTVGVGYSYVDSLRYRGPDITTDGAKISVPARTVRLLEAVGKTPAEANRIFQIPNERVKDPVIVPLNPQTDIASATISQVCFNEQTGTMVYEVANQSQLSDIEWRQAKAARSLKDLDRLKPAGCSTSPLVTGLNIG